MTVAQKTRTIHYLRSKGAHDVTQDERQGQIEWLVTKLAWNLAYYGALMFVGGMVSGVFAAVIMGAGK